MNINFLNKPGSQQVLIALLISSLLVSCADGVSLQKRSIAISDLQGCSHTSPYNGKQVENIQGVVTHKYNTGFTIQSITPDVKDCSSEGIFIFTGDYPNIQIGDLVRVNGKVNEYTEGDPEDHNLSKTEIQDASFSVLKSEVTLPAPIVLDTVERPEKIIENDRFTSFDIQEDGLDFYESLEFMLVEIDKGIVIEPLNSYNEVTILPVNDSLDNLLSDTGALLITPSDENPEKITVKFLSGFDQSVNVGDTSASPIVGVMDYSYGNYKIYAASNISFDVSKNITSKFETKLGGVTIATYNLENLSVYDDERLIHQISRQIVDNLNSPDILVLNEIMDDSGTVDDGTVESQKILKMLVNEIAVVGGPEYSFSDNSPKNNLDGGIEGGNIRTVILFRNDCGLSLEENGENFIGVEYRENKFVLSSNPLRIGENSSWFEGSRKPTIWLFSKDGMQFFVIGLHLVSQGKETPAWGNIQPPAEPETEKRIQQAQFIASYAEALLTYQPDIPVILAGDINDTAWSETVKTLEGTSFINLADSSRANDNFSYIFEGNAHQLDYIFLSKNRYSNEQTNSQFIHLNTLYVSDKRVSDHDPFIAEIGFK